MHDSCHSICALDSSATGLLTHAGYTAAVKWPTWAAIRIGANTWPTAPQSEISIRPDRDAHPPPSVEALTLAGLTRAHPCKRWLILNRSESSWDGNVRA